MGIRTSQNPGIGGIDELTAAEETFIKALTALTYSQGDILYYNGSNLVNLGPGTTGQFLKTQGASANPVWAAAGGGASLQHIAVWSADYYITTNKKYTTEVTGTGTVAEDTGGISCATGSTDSSSASLRANNPGGNTLQNSYDEDPEFYAILQLTSSTSTNFVSSFICLDAGASPSTSNVLTRKHFGLILDTTVLVASNADGSTQTIADISSGITMTLAYGFRIAMTSGTNIKFYADEVLKSTSTTNLPSGSNGFAGSWKIDIDNDAGVTTSRRMIVGSVVFKFNAE